jgi:serine/threonine-protein kinase RsbW
VTDQLDLSTTAIGPVEIRVPAEPSLSRVLRLAASGLVAMAEFSIDEIEDVKIAVSEVLIALVEHGDRLPVDIRFHIDGDVFTVEGSTVVTTFDATHPDLALCRTVLASVSADHGIDVASGVATIWATVRHERVS